MSNDPCANPDPNNTNLVSACRCQAAAKSLTDLTNAYLANYEQYLVDSAAYNAYLNAEQTWKSNYTSKRAAYAKEVKKGSCNSGGFCSLSNCPSGWASDGSVHGLKYNCKIAGLKTGCQINCIRSKTTLDALMVDWEKSNPRPTVVNKPTPPTPPSGINIQCCSQLFSGIEATNVNFANIQQQCEQNIQQQIENAQEGKVPSGSWAIGEWGECSAECGDGVQTRLVSCPSGDGNCDPQTMPTSSRACNLKPCVEIVGEWKTGDWGECVNGEQKRTVECSPSNCTAEKPQTTRTCAKGLSKNATFAVAVAITTAIVVVAIIAIALLIRE